MDSLLVKSALTNRVSHREHTQQLVKESVFRDVGADLRLKL